MFSRFCALAWHYRWLGARGISQSRKPWRVTHGIGEVMEIFYSPSFRIFSSWSCAPTFSGKLTVRTCSNIVSCSWQPGQRGEEPKYRDFWRLIFARLWISLHSKILLKLLRWEKTCYGHPNRFDKRRKCAISFSAVCRIP